ncbi:MAG TPA: substrate binding domain-containing protein [Burkholderiaceae bacterium]|nr:substrate binding domain-containing protein [Burkholderiaceae bacterium]
MNIHTNIGRARIVPALPTFLARHPQLQVDVEMTSGALSVVEHGVDLVVRILDPPDSSLVARRIGGTRFVTCASPEYLRRHGVPAEPSELSRHNCLLYILPEGKPYDVWRFQRGTEVQTVAPAGNLRLNDGHALADVAARGGGIVHLLHVTVERRIADGTLRAVLGDWHAQGPPIYVLYPKTRYPSPKVRAFTEFVSELFAEPPPARDDMR